MYSVHMFSVRIYGVTEYSPMHSLNLIIVNEVV
jgi:hypothetical protein